MAKGQTTAASRAESATLPTNDAVNPEKALDTGGPVADVPAEPEWKARVDAHVAKVHEAAEAFRQLDQEAVDRIVTAMVHAGINAAGELAFLAVAETGFGVFEDKVVKNMVATEFLYDYLRGKKTVGVIDSEPDTGIDHVAEPVGTIMAITPITNPTSTVLFKAICAAKTRNAIVFRPHPIATKSALRVVEILSEAGEAAGMPKGALSVIPDAAHEVTHYLFRHPKIDFLWTTGGPRIVELTNSAGKPSLSVGPGNAPCYVHKTADIGQLVVDVLISKTFDASVICPAEQTLILDDEVHDAAIAEFVRMGAYLMTDEESAKLAEFAFGGCDKVNLAALGQKAPELARRAGLTVPEHVKVLLAPLPSDIDQLKAHPLSQEKLMPLLGVVRATSEEHGIQAAVTILERGGLGHTCSIYARDEDIIRRYSLAVRTGRILVNAPTAVGALGGIYNSLPPTFSLGCGTWGGSMTTDNVNYRNLLNIKMVSRRKSPSQWIRVPSMTFFNAGALENLRLLPFKRIFVVSDHILDKAGILQKVKDFLPTPAVEVFTGVQPEPHEDEIRAGIEIMKDFQPDAIVAVGGGSVIDAAKAMRLFFEHPDLSITELSLPFLDPRKRVTEYPSDEHTLRLIAVPTTAGTGSEVSPGAVITVGRRKASLIDYSLTPDIAVIDPDLTLSLPPGATADTALDALTHALESSVSIFASAYTDGLCLQAVQDIVENLPKAFAHGTDIQARTALANAATMAGMAFSNTFLGVNHACAHAIGAIFHIAHGRANAILLPHVIRYNSSLPTKFMPSPGYSTYVAPEKYARIGKVVFGGETPEEQREKLIAGIERLIASVGMPRTLKDAGVHEDEFLAAFPELVAAAFADPALRTNPRMPLVSEVETLLKQAFYGV